MKEPDKQAKKPIAKPETRSLLEDWQSFRAWQEALFKTRNERVPVIE
jgi:hypothetical protein